MRLFQLFSATLILGCSSFLALSSDRRSREPAAWDIYEFEPDEELRDERILALFKIATEHYNHNELKKLVRTVKADPQPSLLFCRRPPVGPALQPASLPPP